MVKVGDRVELVHTNDPYTRLRPGVRGTVLRIFYPGERHEVVSVKWDDGSRLAMLYEDRYKVVSDADNNVAKES